MDAFIEAYCELDENPSEEHLHAFRHELDDIADSFISWFPSHFYGSPYSPIPSKVLVSRITQGLDAELKTIPGKLWPRIDKFANQAAIRKERGISVKAETINSIFARDIHGLQIGTTESTQIVSTSKSTEDKPSQDTKAVAECLGQAPETHVDKQRRTQLRLAALDELTQMSQELGLGYD